MKYIVYRDPKNDYESFAERFCLRGRVKNPFAERKSLSIKPNSCGEKKGFPVIRAILTNIWNFYQEKNHLWGNLFRLCFSSEPNVFDNFVPTFIQCPYINKDGLRYMPIELLLYLFLICQVLQEIAFFRKTSWLH